MTIQAFQLYTAKGYAGDLVDSGPRVVQTGVLTSATVGFGKLLARDSATVDRGVATLPAATATFTINVFAISQREYNHEAGTRPSTGTDFNYKKDESVSIIREGYVYMKIAAGSAAVVAGVKLRALIATGEITMAAVSGQLVMPLHNVFAEQAGAAGDVIKCRIVVSESTTAA